MYITTEKAAPSWTLPKEIAQAATAEPSKDWVPRSSAPAWLTASTHASLECNVYRNKQCITTLQYLRWCNSTILGALKMEGGLIKRNKLNNDLEFTALEIHLLPECSLTTVGLSCLLPFADGQSTKCNKTQMIHYLVYTAKDGLTWEKKLH